MSITVTPNTASLSQSQTQQFNAYVTNSSNTAVTWSVSPNVGSISSTGLYTAPSTVSSSQTVTVTATSQADSSKSASATVTITATVTTGTSYYLATSSQGGNDANNGLSPAAPWLTPNHPLNCGDVITAAASNSYDHSNFGTGSWGNVLCSGGNNVAWLKCATFDGCKITSTTSGAAMWVDNDYWGVQGWEATTTSSNSFGPCFMVAPRYSGPRQIHHVIFANNIANGCQLGGFGTNTFGGVGVDYAVFIGNIAYNAVQGSDSCTSAFSIYETSNSDNAPGTHIYLAGNFAWGNIEPAVCNGTAPTDGEGIILDTLQQYGYSGQVAGEDNIMIFNGGPGISGTKNTITPINFQHNTTYGNMTDPHQTTSFRGEYELYIVDQAAASSNIFVTSGSNAGGGGTAWASSISNADSTNSFTGNFVYSPGGTATRSAGGSFVYGSNTNTNPLFANPVMPSAPNCGANSSVNDCMAGVISNFTPNASSASDFGYRRPSSVPTYDPLFPQWLCNVSLPSGLVSLGCRTTP